MPQPHNDVTPHDFSEYLAKSQLSRRVSVRSNNTSNSSKIGSRRISKAGCPANNPHYIQRRRTTAAYRAADRFSNPQRYPWSPNGQCLWNDYQAQQISATTRPYSWHPGYNVPGALPEPIRASEPTTERTIIGLENLAVTERTPSVEESIQNAVMMGHCTSGNDEPPHYVTQGTYYQDYNTLNMPYGQASNDATYTSNVWAGDQEFVQDHSTPSWLYNQSGDAAYEFDTLLGPSMASQQLLPAGADSLPNKELPEALNAEGEELVGIGLYDKEEDTITANCPKSSVMSTHGKGGRELKLEETWQPSPTDEDDEESSMDAEELDDFPTTDHILEQAPTTYYAPNSDLSNQSFFFNDDDDTYDMNDPYHSYLALPYNNVQACQETKSQLAGSGSGLWF